MSNISQVYVIKADGQTTAMNKPLCKDEDIELQQLLHNNPDLLPGEQISPSSPRRWLLIKREMPVPDPRTGVDRWSLDFFFADQDAIPTFVECKKFLDTDARRKVIGQMLDYAANGQHYWTKEKIRRIAEETAKSRGYNLGTAILQPDQNGIDKFFEIIMNNLKEGKVRLIFFLDEAPQELKSIVEFLNTQMERSEVLIVEAKRYEHDGIRVIIPTLFGYTEQARLIKMDVKETSSRQWNEEEFFLELAKKVPSHEITAVRKFYAFCSNKGYVIKWGKGMISGSVGITTQKSQNISFIQIITNGRMYFNLGWMKGDEVIESIRDQLFVGLTNKIGFKLPSYAESKYPSLTCSEWTAKEEQIEQLIESCFGNAVI